MRAAITTKYHGPTNTRGSRIIATCQAGRITHKYDYEIDNHAAAARTLAEKLNWHGLWIGGGLPTGDFVWVLAPDSVGAIGALNPEDAFRVTPKATL